MKVLEKQKPRGLFGVVNFAAAYLETQEWGMWAAGVIVASSIRGAEKRFLRCPCVNKQAIF